MTYAALKKHQELILLDCISGSTAYNLNITGSDIDKKGIFIMPQKQLYGFEHTQQIANHTNVEVYFEIGRFLELLTKNYLLFHQSQIAEGWLKGISSGPLADDIQLSSVPKGVEHLAVMNFNKESYSVYCKEYKEYHEWEANRNEQRYQSTLKHGKSYDAKNMMHTFRLLNMAEEIAIHHKVIVKREDRDFLLKIRNGEY